MTLATDTMYNSSFLVSPLILFGFLWTNYVMSTMYKPFVPVSTIIIIILHAILARTDPVLVWITGSARTKDGDSVLGVSAILISHCVLTIKLIK